MNWYEFPRETRIIVYTIILLVLWVPISVQISGIITISLGIFLFCGGWFLAFIGDIFDKAFGALIILRFLTFLLMVIPFMALISLIAVFLVFIFIVKEIRGY